MANKVAKRRVHSWSTRVAERAAQLQAERFVNVKHPYIAVGFVGAAMGVVSVIFSTFSVALEWQQGWFYWAYFNVPVAEGHGLQLLLNEGAFLLLGKELIEKALPAAVVWAWFAVTLTYIWREHWLAIALTAAWNFLSKKDCAFWRK